MTPRVALAHDYLTQRGGAERVVLSMLKAFPDAPLYTSLYDPTHTFDEFASADIHTSALNRVGALRRHHRAALPVLAPAFAHMQPEADVVLCSSSGWAHGVGGAGTKVVYCYAPARWLYQADRYLRERGSTTALALRVLRPFLLRWDERSAARAETYVTSSTAMQELIRAVYGREAILLPPPQTLDPEATQRPVPGVESGFLLCVSRLLSYKNVDCVVDAFVDLPAEQLIVVGAGPDQARLRARAPQNVRFVGRVDDDQLRWLYANSRGLVAAAHEDFGLTPLEAAAFGKPAAVLNYGGFLDTVRPGETGVLFDTPSVDAVRDGVVRLVSSDWDEAALRAHADRYAEPGFIARLREIVMDATSRGAA